MKDLIGSNGRPGGRESLFRLPVLLLVSAMAFAGVGCNQPPTFVSGKESADVVRNIQGVLIINQGFDSADPDAPRILAISLPDLKKTVVRRVQKDRETGIYAIAGPDDSGKIAFLSFLDDYRMGKSFELKTIDLDGNGEETIFTRPGSVIWDDVVGESISMSPHGGLVALLQGKLSHQQLPDAYLAKGKLQIWDVGSKEAIETDIDALDDGLSWFPTGKQLAYVELIPRSAVGQLNLANRLEDAVSFKSWDYLPVVHIWDVESKTKRPVAIGWRPVVATDGSGIVISDLANNSDFVDLKGHKTRRITWPGHWGDAIAFFPGEKIIHIGLPTAGSKPRWIKHGSFRVGSPMVAAKIAEIGTRKFLTIEPVVDPRDTLSFGAFVKH